MSSFRVLVRLSVRQRVCLVVIMARMAELRAKALSCTKPAGPSHQGTLHSPWSCMPACWGRASLDTCAFSARENPSFSLVPSQLEDECVLKDLRGGYREWRQSEKNGFSRFDHAAAQLWLVSLALVRKRPINSILSDGKLLLQ